jgi:hypothetical protein
MCGALGNVRFVPIADMGQQRLKDAAGSLSHRSYNRGRTAYFVHDRHPMIGRVDIVYNQHAECPLSRELDHA